MLTDEDLKRLKMLCVRYKDESYEVPVTTKRDLQALIARLEAAEEALSHAIAKGHKVVNQFDSKYEAWRKAKGK